MASSVVAPLEAVVMEAIMGLLPSRHYPDMSG
jgi:hypothetical protein